MDHGAERRENLIALSQHAEKFECNGYRGLFAFVSHLRKLLDLEQAPATPGASAVGGVQMMSIHKSKGLEFPIVILADLDHSFSRQDFTSPVLVHPELGLGPQCIDLKRRVKYPTLARLAIEEKLRRENLAEEQRILYVAMTRAKEKLILVSSLYSASGHLKKLAAGSSCPALPEAVAAGKSFSDWILLPLLCKPEAEPLRRFADLSVESLYHSNSNQWQVFIHDSEQFRTHPKFRKDKETEPLEESEFDGELLGFEYPYPASITASAKVTATQLKGRVLDDEIKEHTPVVSRHQMLKHPRFWQEQHGLTAAEQGTATHIAMQYLDFSDFDVEGQITKMVDAKKLSQEQANSIDLRALKRFLESELAKTLRGAKEIQREFPFMQLIDANILDRNTGDGEQVLLQGVIDCFYEDCDGLVVIDFKTDRVFTEELLRERIENYRIQLETYSKALEIIFGKPVSKRILYFLSISRAVEL
jgi:ATP-dependent helicase/nuclease subunit A